MSAGLQQSQREPVRHIVFWQGMISPHMFPLARDLSRVVGNLTFVATQSIDERRTGMGWQAVDTTGVETVLFSDPEEARRIATSFADDVVHVVMGVRGNGLMKPVRRALIAREARWGATLETIDERSVLAPLKRLAYRAHLSRRPDFILAIGLNTSDWICARGYPADHVFPMTYFIEPTAPVVRREQASAKFRIGFVGRLIKLKRVDLLIDALAKLRHLDFELVVIGDGPLKERLQRTAERKIGSERVSMLGWLPMQDTIARIAEFDCLVLPSEYDGWGVVVTEGLMSGVPAVASDACGAAEAVIASGVGGVFPNKDAEALRAILAGLIARGPLDARERVRLADWASAFSPRAGARYLKAVLSCVYEDAPRPVPPWREGNYEGSRAGSP